MINHRSWDDVRLVSLCRSSRDPPRHQLMPDAMLALIVAGAALAIAIVRLSILAVRTDNNSPARLVAELRRAQFGALVMAGVAGTYVGFALTQSEGNGSGLDIALAVGFVVLASYAQTQEPATALTLVAAGFGGHAVVDLLHGATLLPSASDPEWYQTACALYDVAVAGLCYLPILRR